MLALVSGHVGRANHGASLRYRGCNHRVDEDALFYLRTRGLDPLDAKRVLTRAFATRVIRKSPIPELHELLNQQVDTRLAELGSGV